MTSTTTAPTTIKTPSNAGTWCESRALMESDRVLSRALRGGTRSMRAMRHLLLPMDFRETQEPLTYQSRLLITYLYPAYDETIKRLARQPFQDSIALTANDSLPEPLQKLEMDCDRNGTPLTEFFAARHGEGWDTGRIAVLVDYPRAVVDGRPMTKAEEANADVRPYFVPIHSDDLIDWSWVEDNGRMVLDTASIYSETTIIGPKNEQQLQQTVMVWSRTGWEKWQRISTEAYTRRRAAFGEGIATIDQSAERLSLVSKGSDTDTYTLIDRGDHQLGQVPIEWVSASEFRQDPLRSNPPLIDLAWKNVEDWQVGSWHNNNLAWHSYPVLWVAGMDGETARDGFAYGAGATLSSRAEGFKVGFVETTGASADRLKDKRMSLLQEMRAIGMAPLVEAAATATGVNVDEDRSQTQAQAATERTEWLVWRCFRLAAKWLKVELPDEFDVDIDRGQTHAPDSADHLNAIQGMRQRGDLSLETALREMQRRGILDRDLDIEEEIARIDQEGPSLSDMVPAQFGGAMQQTGDPMPQDGEQQGDPQQDPQPQPQQTGNVQP